MFYGHPETVAARTGVSPQGVAIDFLMSKWAKNRRPSAAGRYARSAGTVFGEVRLNHGNRIMAGEDLVL